MSRSPSSRELLPALLLVAALSSTANAQNNPPVMRLDESGRIAAPGSPPCGAGMHVPPGTVERNSNRPGATVDACGRLQLDPGVTLSSLSPPLADDATTTSARIDSMSVDATIFNYYETYYPGGSFRLVAM